MGWKKHIQKLIDATSQILFPELCLHCDEYQPIKGQVFCMYCSKDYHELDFHVRENNPVEMHFIGRVPFERAMALLLYKKGYLTQSLLHEFKYRGKKEIGFYLGERMAIQIQSSSLWSTPDLIVPIPLHKRKQKLRGFNQSMVISEGLASKLKCPVRSILKRAKQTSTQTKKNRLERVKNVKDIFSSDPLKPAEKHILIVDDVITTGATVESAILAVQKVNPKAKISIASAALGA